MLGGLLVNFLKKHTSEWEQDILRALMMACEDSFNS